MGGDLVAFLNARLDEDEREASEFHHGDCESLPYPGMTGPFPCNCGHPARVLRDVEAKRAILAELEAIPHLYMEDCYYSCELAVHPDDPERRPGSGYCNDNAIPTGGCTCGRDKLVSRLRGALAIIWRDHPGYDEAWRP